MVDSPTAFRREDRGGGGGGSSLSPRGSDEGTGLTGAKTGRGGGTAQVEPLLKESLRDGGVPVRERVRDTILFGDVSREFLRPVLGEFEAFASSAQC